jgi:CTD small phosphatase-like protein 2
MLKRKRSDGLSVPIKKRKTTSENKPTVFDSLHGLICSIPRSPMKTKSNSLFEEKLFENDSVKKGAEPIFFSPVLHPVSSVAMEGTKKSIFYSDETLEDIEIPDAPITLNACVSCDETNEELVFDPYKFISMLPPKPSIERDYVLPVSDMSDRKTLVLDLDESLVHSSLNLVNDADVEFKISNDSVVYTVYVKKRPGLDNFLRTVSSMFEVVVFTASQKVYAETLLNIIDPNNYIHHRLYRDSCIVVNDNHIKDLSLLGRDINKVIIVDNSPHVFGYHLDNGIPILSWFDDPNDKELELLLPILNDLNNTDNVQPKLKEKYKLQEIVYQYKSCK